MMLAYTSLLFSRDVEEWIIQPIENMLNKVNRIAKNPLEAAQIEENETLLIEELKKTGKLEQLQKIKEMENYETIILEKLIIKIGALLAISFGEAGSMIIAENISKSGQVDPLISGQKIYAVFCFCSIRNFSLYTNILQKKIMIFINEISYLVHKTVDSYCGSTNKNIGEAFFFVWKFDEALKFDLQSSQTHQFSDLPVIACLKILCEIRKSNNLLKYQNIQEKSDQNNQDNQKAIFNLKLGFGLHFGWAIEGAIGSSYKIDASYLSPNVNISSRLEAATKQFGTQILLSGELYQLLSQKCKYHLRHIDRVTVKGSNKPIDLYTIDCDFSNLKIKRSENISIQVKNKIKVFQRIKRNQLKNEIIEKKYQVSEIFEQDQDLIFVRYKFQQEFYVEWEKGLNNYFQGDWENAAIHFNKTKNWFALEDGPSVTLLEYMQLYNNKAFEDWKSFRQLTEK